MLSYKHEDTTTENFSTLQICNINIDLVIVFLGNFSILLFLYLMLWNKGSASNQLLFGECKEQCCFL